MFDSTDPFRRPAGWRRRIAFAVLLALQGAITVSPLLDPGEKGRIGAHAEERGAQHKYQHDETTCAVCAVRSLHASPARSCAPIVCDRHESFAARETPLAPVRRVVPTTLPRAPPSLS